MTTIYEDLGLRTFINARGTITTLGGSIMPTEVVEAMAQAARHFVHLNEIKRCMPDLGSILKRFANHDSELAENKKALDMLVN